MAVAVINFFTLMYFTLFVLYATRDLHVHAGLLGLVLGAAAVGGVLGAALTRRLAAAIGVGWAYIAGCAGYTAPLALVPLAGGTRPEVLGMLFAAEFCSGFGVMVLDISIGSIFAAVIPDKLRARVTGAFQAVNYGTRPIGALAGGILGSSLGLRSTLWIGVVGGFAGALLLLASPLPRFRMPVTDPDADPGAESGAGPNAALDSEPGVEPEDQRPEPATS
jgi:MFS family permease